LDNSKSLTTCQINEIAQVLTSLSSVKANNSTPEQILTASALIQSEYPKLSLGELQKIIIDGIMQKFNKSDYAQNNDIPTLLFWLRKHKLDNTQVFY
jgi:hypothetical protein